MSDAGQMRRLAAEWDFLVSTLHSPAETAATAADAVGVSILAGFLGSGKTTLLRRLLQGAHGLRLAAIVNDFGSVNIDAALIKAADDRVIEMTNGCSCCALGADLAQAVQDLAAADDRPDAIVVEASGIADPAAMATIVAANRGARLDGIVTVVDASSIDALLENAQTAPLFRRQLDAAHLLLLNKSDLLDREGLDRATAQLGDLAPGRPVVRSVNGDLDPAVALGAALRGARTKPPERPHDRSAFITKTIDLDLALDRRELEAILQHPPTGLLRIKGFVRFDHAPEETWMVQAVGPRWSIEPFAAENSAGPPWHGLILIGLAAEAEKWMSYF